MTRLITSVMLLAASLQAIKAQSGSCADYCAAATIGDKCNHFGGNMENCMSWCQQYTAQDELGDVSDTSGDTIGCRQYHLGVANAGDQAARDLHCPHGGPTGGDVCGTHCEVYCGVQYAATCNDIYATAAECTTECSKIAVAEAATATAGNSIQCRLYHMSAAAYLGADVHCPHSDADGSGVCADAGTCADYCAAATIGDKCNHFGGNMENCMSWCQQYTAQDELGFLSDTSGDTIGCRQYHLGVANAGDQAARDLHCPHGGPTGGDVCGTHCEVYCGVQYAATCNDIYATAAECTTECSKIAVAEAATATAGNSIQCRLYHMSAAAYLGADVHCPHSDADGSGVCADAGTCADYCAAATIGDKCNHFGGNMENCMSWCQQYTAQDELGFLSDTSGDTIGCRQYHLGVANAGDQAARDLHCPHGGPTGGDVCGTHCEVYCGVQYAATCNDIYATAAECTTECSKIAVAEAATATAGNSIQCRLYHMSAAAYLGADVHCPHSDADGSGVCADAGTCADYCAAATIGDKCNHFGGDMENCMSWCQQYTAQDELGFLSDTSGDTIGCRQYHLGVANAGDQAARDLHCPHGGPTGGDVCGTHCEVYCGVQYAATCNDIYATAAECTTECSKIAVAEAATATAGNSIQCRLYHMSAAAYLGADVHCPHSDADGSGVCVPSSGGLGQVKLEASATLLGLGLADWTEAAIDAFKVQVAAVLGKAAGDIVVVDVAELTVERRRMLLAVGIKVDYEVLGYASTEEVESAKTVLLTKEAELSTALQGQAAFADKLSGVSLEVMAEPSATTSSASRSRLTHMAWLLVCGYVTAALAMA